MAQLLLAGVQWLCGVPAAPVIAPFIAAALPNPINLVVYAAWLAALKLGKSNRLAWFRGNGSWKAVAKGAAILYALTVLPLWFLVFLGICRTVG